TFSQDGHALNLSKVGSGSVNVDGTLRSLPWSDTFALGAEVTLEAVPDTGWYFAGWAGDASGITNPIAVTMDADRSITANFTQTLCALNISAVGNGSIEVSGSSVVLPYSGSVPYGGAVTVEAVPEYGWRFTGWSGSVVGTDNPVVVMVDDDLDITATFVLPDTYFLTITKAGSGSVSVNGALVSLPWTGEFARNAEVVIEAVIEGEQQFYGWSGDASGTDMSVTLTMDADKAVSAEFMCIPTFPDVPCDHWAVEAIAAVHDADIANGYSDGLYLPDLAVTRAAMAVFIARGLAGGTEGVPAGPEEPTFPDVPLDHWAYSSVEYCADNNVVEGYGSGTYQPTWQVNRAQMAVFIARSIVTPTGEAGLEPYEAPEIPSFNDVPAGYWCYKHVEYLAEHAIVEGYPDYFGPGLNAYLPTSVVDRAQMAVYIKRAFDLP
ncbi:MAG: S-layer homology domain-containing protein, partial [Armatimonadetes bacterium]|nr:S-layer homology domain-containing protein [Armatimonadota bacterium]